MTKEITKAIILQEIQDKFRLREFDLAKFLFDETVVPTYNIEQHLRAMMVTFSQNLITELGAVVFYTIPVNERWKLMRYNVIFAGAATLKLAGVYITRGTDENYIYLDLTANQDVSYAETLPVPPTLNGGDKIWINCDAFTSAMTVSLRIDYEKEEIR